MVPARLLGSAELAVEQDSVTRCCLAFEESLPTDEHAASGVHQHAVAVGLIGRASNASDDQDAGAAVTDSADYEFDAALGDRPEPALIACGDGLCQAD